LGFGAYTFGGIFDVLRIKHREIGLYEGMVTLREERKPIFILRFEA
jgi:hypothetical protein